MRGILAPGPGNSGFLPMGLLLTDDVHGTLRALDALCKEGLPTVANALTSEGAVRVTAAREKIQEVNVRVYRVAYENPAVSRVAKILYGGPLAIIAAPTSEGVWLAYGGVEKVRAETKAYFSSGSPRLMDGSLVKAAMGTLKADPQACLLVDVPRALELFLKTLSAAQGMTSASAARSSGDVPLLALGLYLRVPTIEIELDVPAQSLRAIEKFFSAQRDQ